MKILDRISHVTGKFAAWFSLLLVILICADVFLRYFVNYSKAWIGELEWHWFAVLFLFSMAFTLKENAHVRVDVLYDNYSEKKKAWVNLIGHILFLMPWCAIIVYSSYNYAYNSLLMSESSPNPGGLPARYLIKFCISLGFGLLLIQGISEIIKSIVIIKKT